MQPVVRHFHGIIVAGLLTSLFLLAGCSSTASTSATPGGSGTATAGATATPVPPCTQFVPGATPFSSVSDVPAFQLPTGSYISTGTTSGGGTGQYSVTTYTACFQGSESAIDGGGSSTFSHLAQSGWKQNNLFPDPSNFSYIDYCSNAHECFNSSGSANPFTFVGVDQYASQRGGYTTFRLHVATITAPSCLNDPNYYSGTPKYTIYYDGNSASSNNNNYHFLMPPGTRVSTYQGGGTAGSTYVYYCSAGSQSTIVSFLKQSMQNIGWAISNPSASGFTATIGTSPQMYTITVEVQNPNNYDLRVFVPM